MKGKIEDIINKCVSHAAFGKTRLALSGVPEAAAEIARLCESEVALVKKEMALAMTEMSAYSSKEFDKLESELADAKMTIDVLDRAVEVRLEMEAELVAKMLVMRGALEAFVRYVHREQDEIGDFHAFHRNCGL